MAVRPTVVTHTRPTVTHLQHVQHLLGTPTTNTVVPLVHSTASNSVTQSYVHYQADL
jgi:hypothetical protein